MIVDGIKNGHENVVRFDQPDANRPPGLMSLGTYGAPAALQQQQQQLAEEVWVQNKSASGKFYYYNARTRESAWTKPEGAHIRIITQDEVEQMATFNTKMQTQLNLDDNKIDRKFDTNDLSLDPNKVKNTDSKEPTNPQDNPIDTNHNQAPYAGIQPTPGGFFPPPGMPPLGFVPPFMPPPGMAPMMPPPGMFPPGAFPGFPPIGAMPPYGSYGMPPFGMMPPIQNFHKQKTIDDKIKELKGLYDDETLRQIKEAEEQLVKLRDECALYTEHETPEGKQYFYNTKSNESIWDKPKCFASLKDLESRLDALKRKKLEKPISKDHRPEEKELSEEEKAKQRSKPVSSTPVPNTPWCVVWTRDGRVFFYNPSENRSEWDRPLMLLGRADVDKMVSEPPKEVETINKQAVSKITSGSSQQQQPVVKKKQSNDGVSNGNSAIDSEPPPSKKNRIQSTEMDSPSSIQDIDTDSNDSSNRKIETVKDAAMEAELKAARERAQVPLEQRINQFKEMLVEREVSAFSTWEKELHKIVFDPRYLLLTSKERKQVFEKYIKDRAEEERKEKAAQFKKKKEKFRELLNEAYVHAKMNFNEFASKYCKDERFKQIEKMKERESLFNEFVSDLRKKEKDDKLSEKEKIRKDYLSLLKELKHLHYGSSWTETRKQIENEPRYKAVDSSSKREDLFRDYVRTLPEHSNSSTTASQPKAEEVDEEEEKEKRKEKEKQERIEASIKEREKEVKEQLSKYQSEREKERDQLKRDESNECFKALLSDLVKNLDSNWKETKKSLKADPRWDFCKLLGKTDKEGLFNEHIKALKNKKKSQLFAILDDTDGVTLSSTWKEVKKLLKGDVRFEKLTQTGDLKLDKAFDNYISDKYQKAKVDFKQLLKETKLITYKSFQMIQESEQHLKDIEEILMKDKCYMELECASSERKIMLLEYIEQLNREGPPPPPTATEPNRRR